MLQTRTVEPFTLGLLKNLMAHPLLEPFYLVGGTALALQLGHRFSVDLDLFTHLYRYLNIKTDVSLPYLNWLVHGQ